MRLIDAGALIAEMHNVILEDGEDRRTFYEVIERQPTIAQPEIIRCRECKYWECEKPFATSGRCFIWECANRKGSDYCSEARRIAND